MSVSDRDDNPVKQAYAAIKTKTKVKDSRGRTKAIDYTHRDVQDV